MPEGSMIKTLLIVALIATGAATLVTASWEFSKDRIAANRRARVLESLNSVLGPAQASLNLDPILVSADDERLGSDDPVDVFLTMDQETPVAAIFATVAPDGYNAPIHLLVGILAETGELTGVRVVSHRETPGLGDLIDIRKSDWVLQFNGISLHTLDPPLWGVDKDEGHFDSITGATVTPRAVVKAVHNTLLYFEDHGDDLFAEASRLKAPTDTSLE